MDKERKEKMTKGQKTAILVVSIVLMVIATVLVFFNIEQIKTFVLNLVDDVGNIFTTATPIPATETPGKPPKITITPVPVTITPEPQVPTVTPRKPTKKP